MEKPKFDSVSRLVNGKDKLDERFDNYRNIVRPMLTGGNPYESIKEALRRVGIQAAGASGYADKFGITLARRRAEDIGPARLQSAAGVGEGASGEGPSLGLIEQARESLNLGEGETLMWIADTPADMDATPTVYLAAQKVAPTVGAPHRLGICRNVAREKTDIWPLLHAGDYVSMYLGKVMDFSQKRDGSPRTDTKVRVLKQPAHGELVQADPEATDYTRFDLHYIPHPDENESGFYRGYDRFVIEVSGGGITVQIHYTLSVYVGDPTTYIGSDGKRYSSKGGCDKESWKISSTPQALNLASLQSESTLSTLLARAAQSLTGVADLPASTLAQTTGEGEDATITLDTTAAGHGIKQDQMLGYFWGSKK